MLRAEKNLHVFVFRNLSRYDFSYSLICCIVLGLCDIELFFSMTKVLHVDIKALWILLRTHYNLKSHLVTTNFLVFRQCEENLLNNLNM